MYYNKILILTLFCLCLMPSLDAQHSSVTADNNDFLIVLDPGHGGKDHGCSGHGSIEKKIVLRIAETLKDQIEQLLPDSKVIMTRTEDKFVPLYERAEIANQNKADVFLSIHCNAISHSGTKGTETYIMGLHREKENFEVAKRENSSILLEHDHEASYDGFDPNSLEAHIFLTIFQAAYREQSILLAQEIEKQFAVQGKRKSRGVKEAGFVVLRATAMPSVLIESGFLTHREESTFLNSDEGIDVIANCIFEAISIYKEQVHPPIIEEEKDTILVEKTDTIHLEIQEESEPQKTASSQYTIQLLALSERKNLSEIGLDHLQKVRISKEKNMYKYSSGLFYSREDANKALIAIQALGFPHAFIKTISVSN